MLSKAVYTVKDRNEKKFFKLCDKLETSKFLKNLDNYEYNNFYRRFNCNDNRTYFIISDLKAKCDDRYNIVETLQGIDYHRAKDKWTQETVTAFITEVMQDTFGSTTCDYAKEISKRYNIKQSKLKSMVSFFMGLKRTTYKLDEYFTEYEYTMWKYRDSKTLSKALANKTITEREIDILKQLNFDINQ